jgi:hypothetical protein
MELADALAEHWRARDAAAAAVGDNVFDLDEWREQVDRANAEVAPVPGDRGAEADSEPVPAPSFLALAATTGRYLLIECDGPVPGVGDRIALTGLDGSFTIVRHGCSPLPLDARPCVCVERAPQPVDPLTS